MEESFDESLGAKGKKVKEALDELRKNEIKLKVKELIARLPKIGRCNICTLLVPCKHYKTANEIPKPNFEPSYTGTPPKRPFDVSQYLPNLTPNTQARGFSVRYRGRTSEYSLDFTRTNMSVPNEKKLRNLEKIESYREEKLRKEMEKIAAVKKEEELKKAELQKIEEMKKKYLEKQKKKIEEYKKTLTTKDEEIMEVMEAEKVKLRKIEEKKKKYHELQKKKIEEYNEKKSILKQISKQRVKELVENVVNYKLIKIKRLQ